MRGCVSGSCGCACHTVVNMTRFTLTCGSTTHYVRYQRHDLSMAALRGRVHESTPGEDRTRLGAEVDPT